MTALALGAIFAGISVFVFASSFLKDCEYDDINNAAHAIVNSFECYIEESDNRQEAMEVAGNHFKFYSESFDTSYYILDMSGNIVMCAETKGLEYEPEAIKKLINADEFRMADKELIIYKKKIKSSICNGGVYFIAVKSAEDFYEVITKLEEVLVATLIIVFIVLACVLYAQKKRKFKLLMELNNIAECYVKDGKCDKELPKTTDVELAPIIFTMNKMREIIKSNNEHRLEFMANISHELKTPVTIINGFVTGILDGTISKGDARKYLVRVSEQTNRMIRLIGTMMKIAGIESGSMQLSRQMVNMTAIFIETLFMYEKQIDDKNVTVTGFDSDRTMIYGDSDMLYQIVYNLVDNAVKFVNNGGEINLETQCDEHNISIKFGNTGRGITGKEMPRIFDRFYKTDFSRSHDTSGVGLGLSIVKKFVSFHHGSIILTSNRDEYTEFVLTFPVDKFNVKPPEYESEETDNSNQSDGGEENE
jgi:signal transduction histidine kinase